MKTIWFQDIKDPIRASEFKKTVLGSKIVLDKAIEILYTMIKSGERTKLEDFDSPSWALRQAYIAGRNDALHETINILTVNDE